MQRKFNTKIKEERNTFCQALGGKSSRKMTTKEDEETRGMFKAVLASWVRNICMCLEGSRTGFKAPVLLSENVYYILNNDNKM